MRSATSRNARVRSPAVSANPLGGGPASPTIPVDGIGGEGAKLVAYTRQIRVREWQRWPVVDVVSHANRQHVESCRANERVRILELLAYSLQLRAASGKRRNVYRCKWQCDRHDPSNKGCLTLG